MALAHQATVLTSNQKDFSRVPSLRVADGTA
jgi:predicted nucleic acid-binding protein